MPARENPSPDPWGPQLKDIKPISEFELVLPASGVLDVAPGMGESDLAPIVHHLGHTEQEVVYIGH